jgi:hypothetical protein
MMQQKVELTDDELRQQALAALEIRDGFVKCQNPRCKKDFALLPKMVSVHNNDRIGTLQCRLRILKNKNHGTSKEDIKSVEEELQQLLEYDSQFDIQRQLPLHSSPCTGFKFYCGSCWDRAFNRRGRKR